MTEITPPKTNRRRLLIALLFALPALAAMRHLRPTRSDDIVEIDGWILKRSDLS
jgi:hypothetical protein